MADYTETFTKVTGNTIEVTDFETEFQAIETAIATKLDVDGDTATNFTIGSGFGGGVIQQLTAQASTSGTTISFTGIGTWSKRVTVAFDDVSTAAASDIRIVIGDAGGLEVTGYTSTCAYIDASPVIGTSAGGFLIASTVAGSTLLNGVITITNIQNNDWVSSGTLSDNIGGQIHSSGGQKTLSDAITRLRIDCVSSTFDGGTINVLYEG